MDCRIAIVTACSIGLFGSLGAPPAGAGQQAGAGHVAGATAATPYDVKTEVRLMGVVTHVNTVVHGGASSRIAAQESTLILKTDASTFDVQLAPPAFLAGKRVKIKKGDTVEVIGSRVTTGDAQLVLAREIRKGNTSWTLRDAGGAPMWASTAQGQQR